MHTAAILAISCVLALCLATPSHAQSTASAATLNARQQSIVAIAAFTASGDLERLKKALNTGLDRGLTVNEVKEVLVHMYAYAGFPRSLNGISTYMAVAEDRRAKGIADPEGREASPLPKDMDKEAYGDKVRNTLTGRSFSPPRGWQVFTPVIDTFLKEHLFADIFARDVLDYQSRELATIGGLASMRGTEPQLRSHLGVSLNVGLTEAQLRDFTKVIESEVGKDEARTAREALDTVLVGRK